MLRHTLRGVPSRRHRYKMTMFILMMMMFIIVNDGRAHS